MGVPIKVAIRPSICLLIQSVAGHQTAAYIASQVVGLGRCRPLGGQSVDPDIRVPEAVCKRDLPVPLRRERCRSACGGHCCCCCSRHCGAARGRAHGESQSSNSGLCSPSICSTPAAWVPITAVTTSEQCATWKQRWEATLACGRLHALCPPLRHPKPSRALSMSATGQTCPCSAPCWSGHAATAAARPTTLQDPCPATASARMSAATSS